MESRSFPRGSTLISRRASGRPSAIRVPARSGPSRSTQDRTRHSRTSTRDRRPPRPLLPASRLRSGPRGLVSPPRIGRFLERGACPRAPPEPPAKVAGDRIYLPDARDQCPAARWSRRDLGHRSRGQAAGTAQPERLDQRLVRSGRSTATDARISLALSASAARTGVSRSASPSAAASGQARTCGGCPSPVQRPRWPRGRSGSAVAVIRGLALGAALLVSCATSSRDRHVDLRRHGDRA